MQLSYIFPTDIAEHSFKTNAWYLYISNRYRRRHSFKALLLWTIVDYRRWQTLPQKTARANPSPGYRRRHSFRRLLLWTIVDYRSWHSKHCSCERSIFIYFTGIAEYSHTKHCSCELLIFIYFIWDIAEDTHSKHCYCERLIFIYFTGISQNILIQNNARADAWYLYISLEYRRRHSFKALLVWTLGIYIFHWDIAEYTHSKHCSCERQVFIYFTGISQNIFIQNNARVNSWNLYISLGYRRIHSYKTLLVRTLGIYIFHWDIAEYTHSKHCSCERLIFIYFTGISQNTLIQNTARANAWYLYISLGYRRIHSFKTLLVWTLDIYIFYWDIAEYTHSKHCSCERLVFTFHTAHFSKLFQVHLSW